MAGSFPQNRRYQNEAVQKYCFIGDALPR